MSAFGPLLNAPRRARWWKFALGVMLAAVLGYLGLAAAILAFIRHRGGNEVMFVDVAIPSRWPRLKMVHGQQHITDAAALIRRGQSVEARGFLRSALLKLPSHRSGRLLLARVEADLGDVEAACQTLLEGVAFHSHDPVYLKAVLSTLLDLQRDEQVIALARSLLPSLRTAAECQGLVALAAATASFHRADYDRAEEFLGAATGLVTSADGRLLAAKIDWERGHRDVALIRLRSAADTWPSDPGIHHALMGYLEEAGATNEARRRNIIFQLVHPTLPAARIASLRYYHTANEPARVAAEVESLLRDFSDPQALLALADFAASTADPALALRLQNEAETRGFALEPHVFLTVEAQLAAREFRPALETLRALRENPAWAQRYRALFDSFEAMAHCGLGDIDAARVFLNTLLRQPTLRAGNLLALANRFVALNASEQAHQILSRAVIVEPGNQAALTRLVELQLNLNRIDELPTTLMRLLAMRKPSPDILRVAHHKLGSDLFLFSPERDAALEAVRLALEKGARHGP